MFVLILFYFNFICILNQICALPGNVDYLGLKPFPSKLDAHLLVLSSKDLTCYSTSKPSTSQICESNKCLLKTAYSNSTIVTDRYCSKDIKWFENLLYDGCLTYKNQYICMCSSNFCNGDTIQSIRGDDDCSRNPCPSGSVCLDTNKGYKCICPPWKSTCNYQKPIDCDCQNGGLCVQLQNNKYACSCKYGFTGRYCEKRDSCIPNVCENGGTCICDKVTTIRCLCKPGFSGDICQINDACLPDPNAKCSNNGLCMSDGLGGYYCKCNPNTTGKNCELVITPSFVDVCNPNPCINQGVCTQYGSNDYICICKNDFTGKICETQIQAKPCEENQPTVPFTMPTTNGPISINSFCSPNPCQNGGSCIDLGMKFECACLPSFTGLFCQDSVYNPTTTSSPCFGQICDPCGTNNNPCKNGQCLNQSCVAVCDCYPGYLGQFCDQYFLVSTTPVVPSTPCPTVIVTSATTLTSTLVPCTTTILTSTTFSSLEITTIASTTIAITTLNSSTTQSTSSYTSQITTTTITMTTTATATNAVTLTTTVTTITTTAITTTPTTTTSTTSTTSTASTTASTNSTITSSQVSTTDSFNSLNINITLPIGNSTNDTSDISFTSPVSTSTTKSTTLLVVSTTSTVSTSSVSTSSVSTSSVSTSSVSTSSVSNSSVSTTGLNITESYNTTTSNLNSTSVAISIETTASNLNSTNSTEASPTTANTVLVNSSVAQNTTIPSTTVASTTKGCDSNVDKCCLKPCKNNGRCISTSDSYKCVCPTGFSGQNCEFLDICNTKNPCLCGTCVNDNSSSYGFKCFCPPGFTGQTCERALNCLDSGYECKNGGECVPRILGDYICSCPQPYCGLTCTNVLPNCSVNHSRFIDSVKPTAGNCSKALCNNRGTCVRKSNSLRSFSCHCSTGWIGKSCEYGLNSSYLHMLQQTNKKNLIQDQP